LHLLIPFAQCRSPESQTAFDALALPQYNRLLGKLQLAHQDMGDENSLSPPHERALAAAYGLDRNGPALADGCLPWGAWHARRAGLLTQTASEAWAVITPAQWAVQTNHITMADPAALQLAEADSRTLLAVMEPYFSEDGIRLVYDAPTRWLASSEVFRGLATASVDRVVGHHVDDWLPKTASAKPLRRLQQEMQMLLYTHELTQARAAQGLPAVNSFWVSGTGALAAGAAGVEPVADIVCPTALRDAAVKEDWPAWALAWQGIDANECIAALAALQRGETVSVTLCGERNAWRFEPGRANPFQRLKRNLLSLSGRKVSNNLRNQL
jgi:hypothetical protein